MHENLSRDYAIRGRERLNGFFEYAGSERICKFKEGIVYGFFNYDFRKIAHNEASNFKDTIFNFGFSSKLEDREGYSILNIDNGRAIAEFLVTRTNTHKNSFKRFIEDEKEERGVIHTESIFFTRNYKVFKEIPTVKVELSLVCSTYNDHTNKALKRALGFNLHN